MMNYEKKYNEALERAKEKRNEYLRLDKDNVVPTDIEYIFPELAESEDEDEIIRKWLVDYFSSIKSGVWHHRNTITCEQILAWLERQQEQKPAEWSEEDEKCLQELMQHIEHCVTVYGAEQPEWLRWLNLLNSLKKRGNSPNGLKCSFPDWKKSSDYPKEGCNVSLNGEVKKIQEWSEEDEKMCQSILNLISITFSKTYWKEINWLKSLKNRGNSPKSNANSHSWKPSEEQMNSLNYGIYVLEEEGYDASASEIKELYVQLKKLMED